jgi:CRISPR-associated protein Csd1
MILAALAELAKNEGLLQDLDYEFAPVTRVIELSDDGRVLRVKDIRVSGPNGRPVAVKKLVPKAGKRSGKKPPAQFLRDNAQYIFGLAKDNGGSWSCADDRLHAMRDLTCKAAVASGDIGLHAVVAFLEKQLASELAKRVANLPADYESNDWFVFQISGQEGLVSDSPAVRKWWEGQRRQTAKVSTNCLVTGKPCVPIDKHDAIKGIPGTKGGPGVALVVCKSPTDSFDSYNLAGGAKAPVSRSAAEAYARGLNRLLDSAHPDPYNSNQSLPRRNIQLNKDTAVVFWAADPKNDFPDLFENLLSRPDPAAVGRLFEAPKTGRLLLLDDRTKFYALTLSGGQGRATIRDWHLTSVAIMAERVQRYFNDLELISSFEPPPIASIKELLRSVVLEGKDRDKNIPPNLAAEFFHSVICGGALPSTLLPLALHRVKVEGPLGDEPRRAHLRMQVIKAALRRSLNRMRRVEVNDMLDEKNVDSSYLLGRLFAVLESLQGALGKRNATITDRYYGAASTTPAIAFSRLMELSRHHLSKLRKENVGLAVSLDKVMTAIIGQLPARNLPIVLNVEEQGLFAIGYYHQRQAFFKKKEDGQAKPQEA